VEVYEAKKKKSNSNDAAIIYPYFLIKLRKDILNIIYVE
jgi:hypothetical protein